MVLSAHPSPNQKLKRFSPRKDSPSRQLDQELNYALEQLVLHDYECKKVHAYQRRTHHEELEARDAALAKSHTAALEAASARHEAVRHEAEAVLQRHVREQEEIRLRKEAEERARQEQEARERAEHERKTREAAERKAREERERREAEEQRAKQEAEKRAQSARAETERKERELAAQKEEATRVEMEKARKEQEDAAAAAAASAVAATAARAKANEVAASNQAQAVSKSQVAPPTQGRDYYTASTEAESRHNDYLALHRLLKQFRKTFWEDAKRNKAFKSQVGDMRRAMRTSVGQLTDDKVGNKQAQERVKANITKALSSTEMPAVPVNTFLPKHLHHPENPPIPPLIIYLLSIFSKAVVAAFTAEVAVNSRAAEPIGTLTAQVFSMNELQLPGGKGSLIPILMAKLHACVPILFGISGSESTSTGRMHLGWRTEAPDSGGKRSFVMEQRHHERMTGLGSGYASIALRNFSRTKLRNPYPPTQFWASLSYIVNTPPHLITTSHILLLKAMLDNNAPDRFILFFGSAGVAALREALIEFPKRLPKEMQSTAAARSIGLMVDGFAKERHFRFM